MKKINVLFIDNHRAVTNALAALLERDLRFTVVGEAVSVSEAINIARLLDHCILLVEPHLGPLHSKDIIQQLLQALPRSKVICLTIHAIPSYAKKSLQSGALGYLTKNSTLNELKLAIVEVYNNRKFIGKEIKDLLATGNEINGLEKLTRRELDVIAYIKDGFSSKEIAERAGVSKKTIEVHRYNILKKLKLRNVAALVNFINLNGL